MTSLHSEAYRRVIDALTAAGSTFRENGFQAQAQCPVGSHGQGRGDLNPSLTVTGLDDSVLIYCHSGCDNTDIVAALGLTLADLYDDRQGSTYVYPKENGAEANRIVRRLAGSNGAKTFRQTGNTKSRALFHADRIGDARRVFVVEGEKDVLAIEAAGGVAVCNAGGAGKAHLFDWSPLKGADVEIIADRDVPGRKHSEGVIAALNRDGVTTNVKVVEAKQGKDAADHIAAGCGLDEFVPVQISAESIDGAVLLDEVLSTLKRYVVFADEHQPVAVALWIAATHGVALWQHATRLVVKSPQKRCGKSRLLDIIAGQCHSSLLGINATPPALFRSIGRDEVPPTIIMDEADAIWGTKRNAENNEDLRALFNAGFQRNRPALRCVGQKQEPTEFDTFAMVAFASIGRLPDTIMDRSVTIDLQRREKDQEVARFRMRRDGPQLEEVKDSLAQWISANVKVLADAEPHLPVDDRAADAWEPLVAVADLAGGRWPRLARSACRKLVGEADDDEDALDVLLLADIRTLFAESRFDSNFVSFVRAGHGPDTYVKSEALVAALRRIEESPWKEEELTVRKLAKRLRPFKVRPQHGPGRASRGYWLSGLTPAFGRYIRPEPSERSESSCDQDEHGDDSTRTQTVPDPSRFAGNGAGTVTGHFEDNCCADTEPTGQADNLNARTDQDGYRATDDLAQHCRDCGTELSAPESIARELCKECALSKHNSEASK